MKSSHGSTPRQVTSLLTLSLSLSFLHLFFYQLEEAEKVHTISSFKDAAICTSLPVLDLIDALRPGKINYEIVDPNPAGEAVCVHSSVCVCVCVYSIYIYISVYVVVI